MTGDLKGIASKFEDARALQNGWVAGHDAGVRRWREAVAAAPAIR